jgi:hypothetical protein
LGVRVDQSETKSNEPENLLATVNRNSRNSQDLSKLCDDWRVLRAPAQRTLCRRNSKLMDVFARAARLAIEECQRQFEGERWNCTVFDRPSVFGRLATSRAREAAFVYALSAAAAMHEVTRACARGHLDAACSCGEASAPGGGGGSRFAWAGCSDNVLFGHRLSKRFVDANEYAIADSARLDSSSSVDEVFARKEHKLMNLHNNEVGRRVIYTFELTT